MIWKKKVCGHAGAGLRFRVEGLNAEPYSLRGFRDESLNVYRGTGNTSTPAKVTRKYAPCKKL